LESYLKKGTAKDKEKLLLVPSSSSSSFTENNIQEAIHSTQMMTKPARTRKRKGGLI